MMTLKNTLDTEKRSWRIKMNLREEKDVAYISFNRNSRNTLTTDCFNTLSGYFRELSKRDSRPIAIVLESKAEDVFSYGADPKFFNSISLNEKKDLFVSLMNFCKAALDSHIPFIVDLNGPAMAGGAIVACLSDFAIAKSCKAKLSFSQVKVGIPVSHSLLKIAERRISTEYFSEMILLGKNYDAAELKSMKFVNELYEDSRDSALTKLLGRISRIDKDVMAYTIRNRNKYIIPEIDNYLRDFDKDFLRFLSAGETKNHFEGLKKL